MKNKEMLRYAICNAWKKVCTEDCCRADREVSAITLAVTEIRRYYDENDLRLFLDWHYKEYLYDFGISVEKYLKNGYSSEELGLFIRYCQDSEGAFVWDREGDLKFKHFFRDLIEHIKTPYRRYDVRNERYREFNTLAKIIVKLGMEIPQTVGIQYILAAALMKIAQIRAQSIVRDRQGIVVSIVSHRRLIPLVGRITNLLERHRGYVPLVQLRNNEQVENVRDLNFILEMLLRETPTLFLWNPDSAYIDMETTFN